MKRLFAAAVLAVVAGSLSGCGFFMVQAGVVKPMKKVALVQYAVNPHLYLGTANAPEAKTKSAAADVEAFAKAFDGTPFGVMPIAEMTTHAAYTGAGRAEEKGYYAADGYRFFSDRVGVERMEMPAGVCKTLCEGLGVDAIVMAYNSWGTEPYALGFKAHSRDTIVLAMFDKTGAKVWTDANTASSDEGFATPGGIISTKLEHLILCNNQSFAASLAAMKQRLVAGLK